MPLIAHADWSKHAAKRWMTVIQPDNLVLAPEPVGPPETLVARLQARARGAGVALGLDCPLGLPRAYASRHATAADFPGFLRALAPDAPFLDVAARLDEISPARPFYPARGVRGMTRLSHALALGLPDAAALCRACDLATADRPAGAPLFWTLGANQSGKAAISAWRDLVGPALRGGALLWPFDGGLRALLAPGAVAIAETYPAEAMRHLGVAMRGSKRRQADRAACAPALHAALQKLGAAADGPLRMAIADGFGPDSAGEDRFDCLLGALCVLGVVSGHRADSVPDDIWLWRWEGWVLGQSCTSQVAMSMHVHRNMAKTILQPIILSLVVLFLRLINVSWTDEQKSNIV